MTSFGWARLAAPALLCVAGMAQASGGTQDDSFRVIGRSPTMATWRAAVSRDIGANLETPRSSFTAAPEGVVKLSFHADARGLPAQISVVQSSDSPALDRAAMFAVSRVRTLSRAPAGFDTTRPMEVWIYFANTDAVADRMETRLRREASRAVASTGRTLMIAG